MTAAPPAGEESAATSAYDVPVLVVGSSLVGLTTSVLLSSYGVPQLLVDRHRGRRSLSR